MNIVFFGSFQHYSAQVLESLINTPEINVVGVVTTPPMPVGRKQIITKTPVHILAEQHNISVITPESLTSLSPNNAHSGKPGVDFFVTAGYGKILPQQWLDYPKFDSLNLHFSLLPKFRGANPAEWALMLGETTTGITLMKMNQGLDKGDIIAQKEISITDKDTRETIYQRLYELGAKELPQMLQKYYAWKQKQDFACQQSLAPQPQPDKSPTPYAALLKRDDGFIPWATLEKAMQGKNLETADFPSNNFQKAIKFLMTKSESFNMQSYLQRLPRALAGYPSLWTVVQTLKGEKRMKILSFSLVPHTSHLVPHTIQLEGKESALWNQIKNQIT